MILSTVRDVLHEGRGRDMSIWPYGGNCLSFTHPKPTCPTGFPSPASEERWPAYYKEGVFCNLYDGVMQTGEIQSISIVGQVAEMHESVGAKSLNGRSLGLRAPKLSKRD